MQILERIRRCKHCDRDVTNQIGALAYAENPYCQECLPDRIRIAAEKSGPKEIRYVGGYMFASPVSRKLALDAS